VKPDQHELEIWSAANRECYLYTEFWDFAKEMRKHFRLATYFARNGKPVAWQIKVPTRMVRLLTARFAALKKFQEEKAEDSGVELQ
jgi:hypothetical protein